MKYSICYTKTYYVEVEADSPDGAVAKWEELDLDAIEFEEPSADLQRVEWCDKNGAPHFIYY
jgi:hypothetical protein